MTQALLGGYVAGVLIFAAIGTALARLEGVPGDSKRDRAKTVALITLAILFWPATFLVVLEDASRPSRRF